MISVAQEPVYIDVDGAEVVVAVDPKGRQIRLAYARNAVPFATVDPGNYLNLHRPCWATVASGSSGIILTPVFDDGSFPEGGWGYGSPSGIHSEGHYTDRISPDALPWQWVQYFDGVAPTAGGSGDPTFATPGVVAVDAGTDYIPKLADSGKIIRMDGGRVLVRSQNVEYTAPSNHFHVVNAGAEAIPIVFDQGVSQFPAGTLSVAAGSVAAGGSVDLNVVDADNWEVLRAAVAAAPPAAPVLSGAGPNITQDATTITLTTPGAFDPAVGSGTIAAWIFQREATLNAADWADITGEVASTHTIVTADRSHRIRVKVTATANGLDTVVYSNILTVPAANVPTNSVAPSFTHTDDSAIANGVTQGDTVKVQFGTWSDTPDGYSVEIRSIDSSGVDISRGFTPAAGTYATADVTYQTQAGDVKVYAKVLAHNANGVSSVAITSQLVVAQPAPVGGGRDAFLQPFASTAPWNVAVGAQAQFATPGSPISGGNAINVSSYTMAPALAASGDPLASVTDTDHASEGTKQYRVPANAVISAPTHVDSQGIVRPDGDSNLVVADPTKTYVDETWVTTKYSNTRFDCRRHIRVNIDDTGTGFDGGIRAAGSSCLAGEIRSGHIAAGVIPHALGMLIGYGMAKKGWIAPAIGEDSYASSYAGTIPIGTRLAIPGTVNINSLGLSADGLVLARCLQDYGVYVVDTSAPGGATSAATLVAEQALNGSSHISAMASDFSSKLRSQLKIITNTPGQPGGVTGAWGGPGTPRQPNPPTVAGGGSGSPTGVTIEPAGVVNTGSTYAASTSMVWGYDFSDVTSDVAYIACVWGGTGTLDSVNIYNPGTSTNPVATGTRVGATVSGVNGSFQRNVGVFEVRNPPAGHFDVIARFTSAAVDMAMAIVAAYPVNQTTPLGAVKTQAVNATQSRFDLTFDAGAASDLNLLFGSVRNTDLATVTGFTGTTILAKTLVGTNQVLVVASVPGSTAAATASVDWVGSEAGAAMGLQLKLAA